MKQKSTKDLILDATFTLVYKHGYSSTGIAAIIEKCNIPKGSLYHHFSSKQDLVIAMIEQRIVPKTKSNFSFIKDEKTHSIDVILNAIDKITNNQTLIKQNCPLNKLIIELSNSNREFDIVLKKAYENLKVALIELIENGIKNKEIVVCDANSLSQFIISSIWGNLGISSSHNSHNRFEQNILHLKNYTIGFKRNRTLGLF